MPARKPRLPDRPKPPKLLCLDGQAVLELRRKRGLTQVAFWAQIGVTQSGGSRYESGHPMPVQVAMLLHLAYGTERQAAEMIAWLRYPGERKP